jgi:hypothetical protein
MAIWWPEDWRRRGRELWSSEGARAGYSQVCEMTGRSDGIEVTRSGCSSASRACGVPRFAPVSEMLWGCCGEGNCSGHNLGGEDERLTESAEADAAGHCMSLLEVELSINR